MAWTGSGLYGATFVDVFDATQLAIDLSLTTHKWFFSTNTKTPNFSTDTAYSATNEVTGTNISAGGVAITGLNPTFAVTSGTVKYDHDDLVVSGAVASNIRGGELYADALAGNNLIVGVNYGADYSPNGSLTITEPAGGIFTDDLVP